MIRAQDRRGGDAMSKLNLRNGDWVLVVDGHKALLLQNRGDALYPNLVVREVREHPELPNRELHTDRPGKVHQSAASFHSAVELADRHDEAKRAFIADVAEQLDSLVASDKSCRIIVIAPPLALGVIRKCYTPAVRWAIQTEIDRDWVRLPVHEIETRLRGLSE
jgi:protein required for attachment to host cells